MLFLLSLLKLLLLLLLLFLLLLISLLVSLPLLFVIVIGPSGLQFRDRSNRASNFKIEHDFEITRLNCTTRSPITN